MAVAEKYSSPTSEQAATALVLERLTLRHFKGVREFTLAAGSQDISVYGDNAAGKTTLADAWSWLLFGKDSSGASAFEVKTLGADGEPVHGLEHEVSADLVLPSGERRQLRKVYKEIWTKRRGSAKREFTGHTTEHFVDGVPVRELEYRATIADIAEEASWRLLTDPAQFSERLHWQERRKLLLEVCGDVPDQDVIASKAELADLAGVLGKRTIDDHRKVVIARRTEINRELDRIPVRIAEVERGRPDVAGLVEADLVEDLAARRRKRETAAEKRVALRAGGAAAEKTKELREVEARCQHLQTQARATRDEQIAKLRKAAIDASNALADTQRRAAKIEREAEDVEQEAARQEREMARLRDDWHKANAKQLVHECETSCPTCGQDLPQEAVAQARQRALDSFNEQKAARLTRISEDGKGQKSRHDELAAKAKDLRSQLEAALHKVSQLETPAEVTQHELEQAQALPEPWFESREWRAANEHREHIADELACLREQTAPALAAADAELAGIDRSIANLEAQLSRFEATRKADARIEELKLEEQRLGAEFERLERELWMLEEFVRTKVALLEERINARFRLVRFRLFKPLVNGGLEETCETTVDGVPYGTNLNHGARVRAGLDVISTLQEHFGFRPPVFVDQCESVTSLPTMECQVIRLVVSESDKELRVEAA